jgi:uncharacterized membrane-anchored protein YhcB (DUF1043 family)
MSDPQSAHIIGIAIGKLVDRLTRKREELRAVESRSGKGYQLRKAIKLNEEIEKLEQQIERAELVQESYL